MCLPSETHGGLPKPSDLCKMAFYKYLLPFQRCLILIVRRGKKVICRRRVEVE